ncbi:methylenetetrahydrofolate reductase [Pseudonocardia broussonetiae]|uniref:Methylenetetrahydrofolate reductase n=1 Tax=Pseudonocardia broussonetiae TaxID=2736640 RepID=A0A6M6JJ22_9PSEU|nr:methylenetetrahydrofolate reductase [Pseudonocardia broussonetiae]QJY48094.1 5,10-methylenetetrahydrofolate reductase [Pseudonocardia broussonetiae]
MRPATTGAEPVAVRAALAAALREASYEVLPLRGAEDRVLGSVPREVPLTVTTTEARGLEPTLDLAVRLTAAGYRAAPHLAARMFRDAAHLHDVLRRLREARVDGVFVIGGDGPAPAGPFPDALSLLEALDHEGGPFGSVGIGGYPEGHGRIEEALIERALVAKAPHATHVVTQLCFDAAATVRWARRIREDGVALPVRVGVPGPVARTKLVRIAAGLGLGQSARFLAKQQNLVGRFLLPGGYRPDRLVRRLAPTLAQPDGVLAGLHVYTFNELASTEAWRQRWLARLAEAA